MAYTHRIGLHFRSLTETDVPFDEILKSTQKVYAQYGIRVDYLSGICLDLTTAQVEKFAQIDGTCEWVAEGEYNDVQALGGAVSTTDILVFYVRRFEKEAKYGCGGHAPNRPACIVASTGSTWTTAHEVGHVLMTRAFQPAHSEDIGNLMYKNSKKITTALPALTDKQLEWIKRSPCCKKM
jgi:hypothetical protein